MSRTLLTTFMLLAALCAARAQDMHYFRFSRNWQGCGWLDSSFIAATSDTAVIRQVSNNLALPAAQRQFVSGYVVKGDDGYNRNASHRFGWHFLPGWRLVTMQVEFCDGCAAGLDSNPKVAAGDSVQFCPWGSYPVEELKIPTNVAGASGDAGIQVGPIPASGTACFRFSSPHSLTVTFYDFTGRRYKTMQVENGVPASLDGLPPGQYLLRLEQGGAVTYKKLLVQ